MKPHIKLLLALVLGLCLGVICHSFADVEFLNFISSQLLAPLGQIFLRLIFMVVVPMVFAAIVLGVYELGKGQGLGRIAGRTLFYTLIASSLSVVIGIGLVNSIRPGDHVNALSSSNTTQVESIQKNAAAAKPFAQAIVELIPRNPIDSAAKALDGEMMALMIFALIFGLALCQVDREHPKNAGPMVDLFEHVFKICMTIVDYAMKLAPIAVFSIVFNTAFKQGLDIFTTLLFYVGVVLLGLALQQFVVYSILLKWLGKKSPLEFFKQIKEVMLYAFATASSNATLPRSLEVAEKNLKLKNHISRFVLTVGSTANQNGTALFEGITVLFLAQVYHIELSLAQQIQVVMMSILAGIGTAGVPGGSLPLIMILLQQMHIPVEGMGLILGVDRFLDMCRTTLNVSGDLVIAQLIDTAEARHLSKA